MVGELVDTMANIEYGLLIAIVIDALLLVVIASMNSRKQIGVLSYIVAAVLLVPLTFQMSRLIGACNISSTASTLNDIVGAISPTLGKYVSSVTSREIGWFIFRRVLWSILFVSFGGFGIYVMMIPRRKKIHSSYEDYDNNVSSTTGDWGF